MFEEDNLLSVPFDESLESERARKADRNISEPELVDAVPTNGQTPGLINESNRWPESIPYLEHADVRSQAKTDSETNSLPKQTNEGDMLGEELALQELLRSLESKRLEILASRIRIQEEAKVRADQQFESRTEEVRRQAAKRAGCAPS